MEDASGVIAELLIPIDWADKLSAANIVKLRIETCSTRWLQRFLNFIGFDFITMILEQIANP
jgi:hypothetical protein